jgi:hypothetical protein
MSCIITYKEKQYSEEKFKEYFINNKNEFATSISKNKDVIDSFKRKMEAIDGVFKDSIELASIGSKAQYMQYLSTIFKTSKVKDIVYHGTNRTFEKFSKDAEKVTISDQGMFFAPTRNQARNNGKNIIKAVINSNPLISDTRIERISKKKKQELLDQGYTGYVYSYNKTISSADDIVVFEPEQIHILGNQEDIEGFKEFVRAEETQEEYLTEEEREAMPTDYYMGDEALRLQEREDRQEFRNENSNMPDEDIDDYYNSCR